MKNNEKLNKQKNNEQIKMRTNIPPQNVLNINDNSKINKTEKINKNNILVAIRVRPLNFSEKEESDYKTIKVITNNTLIISIPTEYSIDTKPKINHIEVVKEKQSTYEYDFVFDENTPQSKVYESTTNNLIQQVIEGYNATIFAYGATGTGKTYTMVGNSSNTGIMIRTIRDLFFSINDYISKYENKNYVIKISYIEIYNEIIKDLLGNNNDTIVELRMDANKGLILKNAIMKKVLNEKEAFNLIMKGNKNRTEKNTDYNNNSSRSHAILNIYIEIEEQEIKLKQKKTFGKFMLIDLAGSEKTSFSYSVKNKELGSINKSLLALNKCINLLVTKNRGFIPWRESNLTRLLQKSLSGNGKVVMIATVSMALTCFDETMFTLQFATKAKKLKLNMKKNIIEKKEVGFNKYDKIIDNINEAIVDVKNDIIKEDILIDNIKNKIDIKSDIDNTKEEMAITANNKINNNENKKEIKMENKYDKVYKDMKEHFQSEINLKKKIIEKENNIEKLKDDMANKEYEILHTKEINLPPLQKQLKEQKNEIENRKNKLIKGYIKQSELINKRKDFQKVISFLSNNSPKHPEYYKIYNEYKYNINLLENMTIEHKKKLNLQESKRKDKKIEGLFEQLDLRDKYIREAYEQIEKNNIEFNYKNPELIKSDEIDNINFQPKIIKIKTTTDSLKNIFENRKLIFKNNNKKNEDEEKTLNIKDSNLGKKFILKKLKIKNNRSDNKLKENSELTNDSLLSNRNIKYKKDLFSLSKKSTKGLNINDFIRIKIPKMKSLLRNLNDKRPSLSSYRNQINISEQKNRGNFSEKMINNKRFDYQERITDMNSFKNRSLIKDLETEIQKKIKTILKKNYISRYNNSPFLKLLNE